MGARRKARELALSLLFECDFHDVAGDAILDRILVQSAPEAETVEFLNILVKTYFQHEAAINAEIEKYSDNWKLSRMASVDRNILRLGTTEILYLADVPKNVTINEYLEIAKKYGTEDSSGFVNGILDKMSKKIS